MGSSKLNIFSYCSATPNGAGKTTSIRMMTGLLKPSSGSIILFERELSSALEILQSRLGVVFARASYPNLSARENLEFFRKLYPARDCYSVSEVLEIIGLEEAAERPVKNYSQGMKQRLELGRALINRPELLFLDEPTVGLDPIIAREIRSLIQKLNRQGVTVFLTTHYMEEADELCDRVAFICNGEIVALDRPDNLKNRLEKTRIKVKSGEDFGKMFTLEKTDERQQLSELLKNDSVNDLEVIKPTLEDVFVQLTGRDLV